MSPNSIPSPAPCTWAGLKESLSVLGLSLLCVEAEPDFPQQIPFPLCPFPALQAGLLQWEEGSLPSSSREDG